MESKLFRREEQICPAWPESGRDAASFLPRTRDIGGPEPRKKHVGYYLVKYCCGGRIHNGPASCTPCTNVFLSTRTHATILSTLTSCLIRFGFPGCRSTFLLMTGTVSTVLLSRPTRKQSLTRQSIEYDQVYFIYSWTEIYELRVTL